VATIDVSIDINAPLDKVWDIVSDLDNEPKFWKGTKETKIISRDGNREKRERRRAGGEGGGSQTITRQPKEKIHAKFTKGIIKGSKTINLMSKKDGCILDAKWDIKMSGLAGMFTGMVSKHIRGGTEQALELIKQEAESY